MIYPKKYTQTEIDSLITKLKVMFPDSKIDLHRSDPRFILMSRVIGTQKVDTVPISITETVEIHISEAFTRLTYYI